MSDPKQQILTFPLNIGAATAADEEFAQPFGDSPKLRRSRNTRVRNDTDLPNKAPGYVSLRSGTVGGLCAGFAPIGTAESTVQFLLPSEGSRRIAAGSTSLLPSVFSAATAQNIAYPANVSSIRASPSAASTASPAVCVNAGNTYVATLRPSTGNITGVFVTVYSSAGAVLAPTQVVAAADSKACGLTTHATAGVCLWVLTVAGTITLYRLNLTGLALTATGPTTVYTPGSSTIGTFKVASDGTDFAWITCIKSGVTNLATLIRRDILGASSTTLDLPPATTASSYTAVSACTISGTSYVAVAVQVAGGQYQATYDGTTLSAIGATTTYASLAGYFDPVTSFAAGPSGTWAIYAATGPSGAGFGSGTTIDFSIVLRVLGSGALSSTPVLPWQRCLGTGVYRRSDSEIYPVFALQHCRDPLYANDPTNTDFLLDPSVELFWLVGPTGAANGRTQCIARLGCDAALRYTGLATAQNSSAVFCAGETITVGYLEDQTRGFVANASGYQSRVTTLDLSTRQTRNAPAAQGPTTIAGAYALSWDGFELTEPCAPHQPTISLHQTGGSGPALTGTYAFRVVYQWRDSSGQMHRSAPSAANSATFAAQSPTVDVVVPVLFRDGVYQESFEIILYATLAGGSTFFAQIATPTTKTTWKWTFGAVPTPTSGALNPQLYSTGGAQSPLIAYCPPALSDVALIGSRLWAVDAERPWRVWPSKIKEEGVAFEFNPDLVVTFPASAGAILAVSEARGFPIFLCQRGVWAVAGEGPDNSLLGQGFSQPLQISAIPCTSRESVVRTPVGVMFLSGDRFAIANEQGAQVLQVMDASET